MKLKLLPICFLTTVFMTMSSCGLLSFDKMVETMARDGMIGMIDLNDEYSISKKEFSENELTRLKKLYYFILVKGARCR